MNTEDHSPEKCIEKKFHEVVLIKDAYRNTTAVCRHCFQTLKRCAEDKILIELSVDIEEQNIGKEFCERRDKHEFVSILTKESTESRCMNCLQNESEILIEVHV